MTVFRVSHLSHATCFGGILCLILFILTGCGDSEKKEAPFIAGGGVVSIPSAPFTSSELLAQGAFQPAFKYYNLVDTSRPTPSNGNFTGDDKRHLPTAIWFPGEINDGEGPQSNQAPFRNPPERPFPLMIYCHGFMSFGSEGQYLAQHLAGHGYIVAYTDFPLSKLFAPGGPSMEDIVNQPGDVSFLIDTLLGFNQDPDHPLFGLVDPARIGVMGLSLGGLTTLLTTYHRDLRDPRIVAAASLAGPGSMFSEQFYAPANVPLLIVAGDTDAIVDYETNALFILSRAAPRARLVTLKNGSHTGFAGPGLFFEWLNNPDSVGCAAIEGGMPTNSNFLEPLGDAEVGIILLPDTPPPCQIQPLPRALRPSRQLELVKIALLSFLESNLSLNSSIRAAADYFLATTLAEENTEVQFQVFP